MNNSFLDDVLELIELGSLTIKKALDEISESRTLQKQANDLKQPLLDYMVEHGIVPSEQKEAAASMLNSHAETMQLLKASIDKIIELRREMNIKQASYLGRGDDGHHVTYPDPQMSLNDPYIGRRISNGYKASDITFMRILDNPVVFNS